MVVSNFSCRFAVLKTKQLITKTKECRLLINMEILIGTAGNESLNITQPDVSRIHARLTVKDDMALVLEDMESTNGTYVQGHKVLRKRVDLNTVVRLGSTFKFKISQVVPAHIQDAIALKEQEEIKSKFKALEAIWNEYSVEKRRIQKEGGKSSILSRLPYLITIASGLVTRLCSDDFLLIVCILVGSFIVSSIAIRFIDKKSEKRKFQMSQELERLDEKFKETYLCPNSKCRTFLGYLPYGSLKTTGHCNRCHCNFV